MVNSFQDKVGHLLGCFEGKQINVAVPLLTVFTQSFQSTTLKYLGAGKDQLTEMDKKDISIVRDVFMVYLRVSCIHILA